MCGIVGYWNNEQEAFPVLVESLKKLEYRGYDSFGFATVHQENLHIERQVGKVSVAKCNNLQGVIGIGHTRWATHGGVTEINTHPHRDCTKTLAVVHNGIIENFRELKESLIQKGHRFLSETDTELLAHLIEDDLKFGMDLKNSVMKTGSLIKGRNAFTVLNSKTKELIAFRNGSPLIIGIKENETFLASDIQAFLDKTRKVMYLDDNQLVIVKNNPEFYNAYTGERIEKRIIEIGGDIAQSDKGDYSHFMLKEIMDQKETISNAINQNDIELMHVAKEINEAKGVFFIGCGTAARVCHFAEYAFSKIAKKHINFIPASEFENFKHFLIPETLVIAISQSGETADVLDALNAAKQRGSKIISIVNAPNSSMTNISDYSFLINAGPEKAVASTKATTSQMAITTLLAYACAGKLREGDRVLVELAGQVNDMLNPRYSEHIKNLAEIMHKKENTMIIGRGMNFPIALESAIKIMEVSYIHAQGFAGGELKHGPIALIEQGTPVIALVGSENKEEIISNAIEVKSRGAYVIGISSENNDAFDYWIKTPNTQEITSSIVNLIPIQLLAYYLGLARGHDVDYPKNLAKSVTVK